VQLRRRSSWVPPRSDTSPAHFGHRHGCIVASLVPPPRLLPRLW
jgi:hypothetical protein